MSKRTKWAIAAFLIILACGFAVLWFWNSLPRPYERPPKPTKAKEKLMEKARMRNGKYTQIIAVEGIYLERKGKGGKHETVWVMRRGKP